MFNTIVLALDGSEETDRLINTVRDLSPEHGHVVVVHVTELFMGRGGGSVRVGEKMRLGRVREQVDALTLSGLEVDLLHTSTFRNPADSIVRAAARVGADLIVMGAPEHNPLVGALAGSAPRALLHRAPCPVLVVSPRAPARSGVALAAA
jgi:nucleotide-binding universal stress UspA family protein